TRSTSEATVKITQVAVNVVRVPVDRPYRAGGRTVDANWHVLARIATSDGLEGIGYIVYPRPDLMTTIASAARELGEHLIGMSVLEPEAAWEKLARRGDWVGPGGLLHCALAPLDIAVWDAYGKSLGQPLHRLLGGFRDRLPSYASDGLWYSLSPHRPGRRRQASRGARLQRREAAPRPRGNARAGSTSRAGGARGYRPRREDHGRHQRDLDTATGPARRPGSARGRHRLARGPRAPPRFRQPRRSTPPARDHRRRRR